MGLLDRYPKRALGMATFQASVWLLLVIYGLTPPSLGARLLLPGLVMTAAFGALVWMTLHRPWGWDFSVGGSTGTWMRYRTVWEPGLLVGCTLGLTWMYEGLLGWGKRRVVEFAGSDFVDGFFLDPAEAAAWKADTYGALLLSQDHVAMAVILPLLILGLLWFFLPR